MIASDKAVCPSESFQSLTLGDLANPNGTKGLVNTKKYFLDKGTLLYQHSRQIPTPHILGRARVSLR